MKLKHGIIALTIAAASVAGVAHAFPGGHCGGQGAGERMEKLASSRLEKLHGDLKLSPDQESAWKAWSGSLQSKFENARQQRPDREAMEKLPAPDRMEQMLERMKTRQKEMEAEVASLRNFYATLSPEQKQTFDNFRPFGERREAAKRKD